MRTIEETSDKGRSVLLLEDGAPLYLDLRAERDRLLKLNAKLIDDLWKQKRIDRETWETLEDVATGAGLECPLCHKNRPCLCFDTGS